MTSGGGRQDRKVLSPACKTSFDSSTDAQLPASAWSAALTAALHAIMHAYNDLGRGAARPDLGAQEPWLALHQGSPSMLTHAPWPQKLLQTVAAPRIEGVPAALSCAAQQAVAAGSGGRACACWPSRVGRLLGGVERGLRRRCLCGAGQAVPGLWGRGEWCAHPAPWGSS